MNDVNPFPQPENVNNLNNQDFFPIPTENGNGTYDNLGLLKVNTSNYILPELPEQKEILQEQESFAQEMLTEHKALFNFAREEFNQIISEINKDDWKNDETVYLLKDFLNSITSESPSNYVVQSINIRPEDKTTKSYLQSLVRAYKHDANGYDKDYSKKFDTEEERVGHQLTPQEKASILFTCEPSKTDTHRYRGQFVLKPIEEDGVDRVYPHYVISFFIVRTPSILVENGAKVEDSLYITVKKTDYKKDESNKSLQITEELKYHTSVISSNWDPLVPNFRGKPQETELKISREKTESSWGTFAKNQ
jgi:hypothetical protein